MDKGAMGEMVDKQLRDYASGNRGIIEQGWQDVSQVSNSPQVNTFTLYRVYPKYTHSGNLTGVCLPR